MKKVAILVAILVVMCSMSSVAQTVGGWSIGVGAEGGIPMGDFSNFSSFGIGGTAWAGYNVDPNFVVGLRSGYVRFSGKDYNIGGVTVNTSFGVIPIVAEGKYFFMPSGDTRVYGAADVGIYILSASASAGGVSASTSESKLGFAPMLGAQFKAGDKMWVDVHGNYTVITTSGSSTSFVGFGVGLVFDMQ